MNSPTRRAKLRQRISLWMPLILALIAYEAAASLQLQRTEFVGDEPHYMLIAHSLCYDHDADLKNNYEARDYASFYPYPVLESHGHDYRGNGVLHSQHNVGLPLLLTIPYCLLGEPDWARLEMAFLTALASWSIFLLARSWTKRDDVAWVTWAAATFTSPLWTMAPQLYPDTAAILGVAIALLLLNSPSLSNGKLLVLGLVVAWLPWLNVRLALLSLLIIATAVRKLRRSRPHWKQWVFLIVLPSISGVVWLWISYAWYGSLLPSAIYTPVVADIPFSWERLYVALVDLGLGREFGLLTYAPIYWIALVGLVVMASRREKAMWVPVIWLIVHIAFLALSQAMAAQGPGYTFPARMMVPIIPLLAIPLAYAILHNRWLRIVGAGLFLVSVVISIQSLLYPYTALADRNGFSELPFLDKLQAAYPALQFTTPSIDLDLSTIFRQTGQLVCRQDNPCIIRATPGIDEPGVMAFGPYQRLVSGQYKATFSLDAARVDPSALVARIDVAAGQGKRILAQQDIYARDFVTGDGYQPFSLSFTTRDIWQVEFRVYFTGQAKLRLQAIQINPQHAPAAPRAYPGLPLVVAWGASVIVAGAIAARHMRKSPAIGTQSHGSPPGKEQSGPDAG